MSSNVTFGFGCRLEDLRLYDFWEERLVEALPYDLRAELDANWAENKDVYQRQGWTAVKFWADYIRDYDSGHGEHGLGALLAAAINNAEFDGRHVFTGGRSYLLALPRFPKQASGRDEIPLEDDLRCALGKWLSVIGRNGKKLKSGYMLCEGECWSITHRL